MHRGSARPRASQPVGRRCRARAPGGGVHAAGSRQAGAAPRLVLVAEWAQDEGVRSRPAADGQWQGSIAGRTAGAGECLSEGGRHRPPR